MENVINLTKNHLHEGFASKKRKPCGLPDDILQLVFHIYM